MIFLYDQIHIGFFQIFKDLILAFYKPNPGTSLTGIRLQYIRKFEFSFERFSIYEFELFCRIRFGSGYF